MLVAGQVALSLVLLVSAGLLMQSLAHETVTIRREAAETALPLRQYGAFLFGDGVVRGRPLRGRRSSRAISPKKPPWPSFTESRGKRTSTSPSEMKNIESPGSSRRTTMMRGG